MPERLGGKTVFVDVSAKRKQLNLISGPDLAELTRRAARSVVASSQTDARGRGPSRTNGSVTADQVRFFFAETSTKHVLPPNLRHQATVGQLLLDPVRHASGLSILLTATMIGTSAHARGSMASSAAA